jgi:hypothetical protein
MAKFWSIGMPWDCDIDRDYALVCAGQGKNPMMDLRWETGERAADGSFPRPRESVQTSVTLVGCRCGSSSCDPDAQDALNFPQVIT